MKLYPSLALFLATALLAAAHPSPADPALRCEAEPELECAGNLAGDRFAFTLFRELVAEGRGNVTFSPASLEEVLHLLCYGAAGETRDLLASLPLGRRGVASAMQVQAANALVADEGLKLKATPAPLLRAPFSTRPSEAAERINAWCSGKTRGLVPQIVSEQDIGGDTRLLLLNAIYLKEKWLRPFDEESTLVAGRFTRADGSELTLPLMRQCDSFRYAEGEDWQAVALFYRRDGRAGEPGCFIGILPKGDARAFARELTLERYDTIRRALAAAAPQETRVTLPRMDIDSGICPLRKALTRMGLGALFSSEADFSGFVDERKLSLSNVVQRCRVLVSEKETEAAAVTGAIMAECAFIPEEEPKEISFTRPFIWAIADVTSAAPPYFLGLCEEPARAEADTTPAPQPQRGSMEAAGCVADDLCSVLRGGYVFYEQPEAYTEHLRALLAATAEIELEVRYASRRHETLRVSLRGEAQEKLLARFAAVEHWCGMQVNGFINRPAPCGGVLSVGASFRDASGRELLYQCDERRQQPSLAWFEAPMAEWGGRQECRPSFLMDFLLPHLPGGWQKPLTLDEVEELWAEDDASGKDSAR